MRRQRPLLVERRLFLTRDAQGRGRVVIIVVGGNVLRVLI